MREPSRILLVDDKDAVRESLWLALEDFGCAFDNASDGQTALGLARRYPFAVVFLDLRLPDLDGMDVLRELVQILPSASKVVIVTALPDARTKAEAIEAGAFRYLHKPLDYAQIRRVFAEATALPIRDEGEPPAPVVTAADESPPSRPARTPTEALQRVLVLDDSKDWLDQIQEVLEPFYDVVCTTDDVDAERWTNGERFAMTILDMKLARGMTAMDVLSRLRMTRPHLEAIILSDYSDYTAVAEPGGAVAYLSKKQLAQLPEIIRKRIDNKYRPIRVFLSYDTADRERVVELYDRLLGRGFLPWIDFKSIVPGQQWSSEIHKAIEEAHFFIFCISRTSVVKNGMVREELQHALDKQRKLPAETIFIITARLENCDAKPPVDMIQYADLFAPDGYSKLFAALSSRRKE